MHVQFFRCVSTVRLGFETVGAGGIFQAVMSDYIQALLDNGLVVAVNVSGDGVKDVKTEPVKQALHYGVAAMSC